VWLDTVGIVLEALLLTAIVVVSLTAYTYWAAKNGHDFSFLGPILFTSLIVIVLFGFVQVLSSAPVFPPLT
jgi:FtsH-binding integral membrane protein